MFLGSRKSSGGCCGCLRLRKQPVDKFNDVSEASSHNHNTCETAITTPSELSTEVSLETSSSMGREPSDITPVHISAVNGDKATLSKLISAGWVNMDTCDRSGRTALMYSVLGERLECVEVLLKAGADVHKKDMQGRTALHWAALKGNVVYMKLLLNRGAVWNEKDNDGQTALHFSTRHKSPRCLTLLLKQLQPGEVDDQDNNKRTALHMAAVYGNVDQLKLLIRQDSNISIPDIGGKTPLHLAASCLDPQAVDCVDLLLDYDGCTALHLAVACGNISVVRALVSVEGCIVGTLDNLFRTPLHWAAVYGHTEIGQLLLDHRADYSSSDGTGGTPLHYAAQNNHADTVWMMLRYPGVRDEVDNEGRTAFLWSACQGADRVMQVFIEHGVDLLQSDKTGSSALHMAAYAGHMSTVKLLLDHRVPIDITDLLKQTALFRACEMGHLDVVRLLIDQGATVDIYDQDGCSPLHWAALGGHAYICQLIIKFGIDPDIRDSAGRTPLQCAAYGGFVNCMSALLEHKADPNACDKAGMTSLQWACNKGHLDAVKLLIQHHAYPNSMDYTEDRYTPLDCALMGEHIEVCQYLLEHGAMTVTGIRDLAAQKIQAWYRGHQVHRTYLERKKLLVKHEQLIKKKAHDENARREDGIKSHPVTDDQRSDVSCPSGSVENLCGDPGPTRSSQDKEMNVKQSKNMNSCQEKTETALVLEQIKAQKREMVAEDSKRLDDKPVKRLSNKNSQQLNNSSSGEQLQNSAIQSKYQKSTHDDIRPTVETGVVDERLLELQNMNSGSSVQHTGEELVTGLGALKTSRTMDASNTSSNTFENTSSFNKVNEDCYGVTNLLEFRSSTDRHHVSSSKSSEVKKVDYKNMDSVESATMESNQANHSALAGSEAALEIKSLPVLEQDTDKLLKKTNKEQERDEDHVYDNRAFSNEEQQENLTVNI